MGWKKYDTIGFIKKAYLIHKNKYNYQNTNFINSKEKIIITCNLHGDFFQNPSQHLMGHGCKKCGTSNMKIILTQNTENFIKKANTVHDNKYDYSQINYINAHKKITIICKNHGEFIQQASSHLQGKECPQCSKEKQKIIRDKIQKLSLNKRTQCFIEKANIVHNNKYNYDKCLYVNMKTKIEINCTKHNSFLMKPTDHIDHKQGCPNCATFTSKPHQKIIDFIKEIGFIENNDFIINDKITISPLELDLFFINKKIAIEIDGVFWHSLPKHKIRDERKNKICLEKNIKLIRITDLEIKNNFEKIKQDLKNILCVMIK